MRRTEILLAVLALLATAALLGCHGRQTASEPSAEGEAGDERPNIIFLTVDTLRADHLALYGYERDTMPEIGELAKTSVVFDNAVVPRGLTRPSYASMLTGLYPYHHGVRSNQIVLHEDLVTLPELLKAEGYRTAAFVSNFLMIANLSGFNQGFDVYDDKIDELESKRKSYERTARNTLKAILRWLDSNPPEPFFLFTNFIDPHGPYHPPQEWRRLYNSPKQQLLKARQIPAYSLVKGQLNFYDYVDRYDGEIRYTDSALGVLIRELKRRGLWRNSLVVFTADHGEELGEHGRYFEHHYGVWEDTVHVPLVIRVPPDPIDGSRPSARRVKALCSPMDLAPTTLSFLDLVPDIHFDGQDLMPVLRGEPQEDDRAILLEFPDVSTPGRRLPDEYALRTRDRKLIRILNSKTETPIKQAAFNLAADPGERHPLPIGAEDAANRELASALDVVLADLAEYKLPFEPVVYDVPYPQRPKFVNRRSRREMANVRPMTRDQMQRLRGLGYLK